MGTYLLCAVLGYLIGSFSMAVLLTKYYYQDDVRAHGSGNAGATNVARVFGWRAGILTFAADFLKCFLSIQIGNALAGAWGSSVAGMACLIGHCFPLWHGFRGGKAVSTGACVALMIDWRLFAAVIVVFALIAVTTRYVSLASVSAALVLIVLSIVLVPELPMQVLGVFAGVLVLVMHIPNIRRLLRGEESRFRPGKHS